jgi:6,7-dimethyl-8-ribityllumazine synthase
MTGSISRDGEVLADDAQIAIVATRWHAGLVEQMVVGARRALHAAGIDDESIDLVHVPGAWELPAAALWLADSERYHAVIALGCVIRGDTPHFEFVAGECARGLMQVQLDTACPVAFGVLTTEDEAQAAERADPARMDKGGEAARAALAMVALRFELDPYDEDGEGDEEEADEEEDEDAR